MGDRPYGDAILVRLHAKTILIDGGHRGDQVRGRRTEALQDQIASCLKTTLPVQIDLLVVTHCHSDHIGCLPELVASKELTVKAALVADEKLGFGRAENEAPVLSDDLVVAKVVAALREEPIATGRNDEELAMFLEDAVTLEDRYLQLLATFEREGIEIARCGVDDVELFAKKIKLRDLSIIAPSLEQLLRCADVISRSTAHALATVGQLRRQDAALSAVELYRAAARPAYTADFLADAPGKGAALNDQSLLIIAGNGKNKCLLTGDMQFAAPEVQGVSREMSRLRKRVEDQGPFALVKLPHHGSYNGVDESVLDEWQTKALVITTGRGHPAHPSASTLELLANSEGVQWARTDKNGLISAHIRNGRTTFQISTGHLSDPSANAAADPHPEVSESSTPETRATELKTSAIAEPATSPSALQTPRNGTDFVEVITRIPNRKTRVTVTIDIDPDVSANSLPLSSPSADVSDPDIEHSHMRFAADRKLPPLLFLTNRKALITNVGETAVKKIEQSIKAAGHEILDVQGNDRPWEVVRGRTGASGPGAQGIVLLGGHDVLPSVKQDVLPPELRVILGREARTESDGFYVWSDDAYGDTDGDGNAELPVTRIPDARSAQFLMRALSVGAARLTGKKGVRNHARPFADTIFSAAGGSSGGLLISNPHLRTSLTPTHLNAGALYFMLHGSDEDGTTFWGEKEDGSAVEAISVAEVCAIDGATVFSGCCWGALTVDGLANVTGVIPKPRQIERSMALTCVQQGANAFVGCTGAHYSPATQIKAFGAPMHEYFWHYFDQGQPAAMALFNAKSDYRQNMFHHAPSNLFEAVEYKILHQFTCLGLAW